MSHIVPRVRARARARARGAHNLAHEDDVLAADEKDASGNVAVHVADVDALDGVLQYEIGCVR